MASLLPPPAALDELARLIVAPHPDRSLLFHVSRYAEMMLRLDLVARPYKQDPGVRLTSSPQLAIAEASAERLYDDGIGIITVLDRDQLVSQCELTPDAGADGQRYHTNDIDLPLRPFALPYVALTPRLALRIMAHSPLTAPDRLILISVDGG